MKITRRLKATTTLALAAAFAGLALTSGCSHTRLVSLRYTPIIQTQRLADRTDPQVTVVGTFADARSKTTIISLRPNPISMHLYDFESRDDVPTLVRSAFVDALLKSGFEVPMQTDPAGSPFLQLTGKVITFKAVKEEKGQTLSITADVGVELTLFPKSGNAVSLLVQGQNRIEQKEFINVDSAVQDSLDRALLDCTRKFLEHQTFRSLLKK